MSQWSILELKMQQRLVQVIDSDPGHLPYYDYSDDEKYLDESYVSERKDFYLGPYGNRAQVMEAFARETRNKKKVVKKIRKKMVRK